MKEGLKVLDTVAKKFGHTFEYKEALLGGGACDTSWPSPPDEQRKFATMPMPFILAQRKGKGPKWKIPPGTNSRTRALLPHGPFTVCSQTCVLP